MYLFAYYTLIIICLVFSIREKRMVENYMRIISFGKLLVVLLKNIPLKIR